MDLILLALIIAAIVWVVRNRGRFGLLGSSTAKVRHSLVTGVVTGTSRHVETTISGSGSGTYERGFRMNVSSNSVLHQQFFVRQDDGVEQPVRTWGLQLPIADGQRVTVIYSDAAGAKPLPGYIVNHASRQGIGLYDQPHDVAVRLGVSPSTVMIFGRAIAAAVAIGIAAWVLGGVTVLAPVLGVVGAPVGFVLVVLRDRGRRRRVGALLLQEYQNQERALLSSAPTQRSGAAPAPLAASTP